MADPNAPPAPHELGGIYAGKRHKFVSVKNYQPRSLIARSRSVAVANLERYPAEMFGMLSEDDWEDILKYKHHSTAPKSGTGGLDGKGRRTPALPERFIAEVEEVNEHLAESACADQLIWKDCVEFSFSRTANTRPKGLFLPWPVLVQQLTDHAALLGDFKKREDEAELNDEELQISSEEEKNIVEATQAICASPMNITLLKQCGVGKILKKLIKASSNRSPYKSIFEQIQMPPPSGPMAAKAAVKPMCVLTQLEKQLQAWMDLAAGKGVDVQCRTTQKGAGQDQFAQDADDLSRAEDCLTWKQLHSTLKDRAVQRRENISKKMRDNRKHENKIRPKIVTVRTLSKRKQAILDKSTASSHTWERGGGNVASHGGKKIFALRKEAAKQTEKQKAGLPSFKKQSGFGQAVAFAATTKLSAQQRAYQSKRKAKALVQMGGGKRMAVPGREIRMHGTKMQDRKPAARRSDSNSSGRR